MQDFALQTWRSMRYCNAINNNQLNNHTSLILTGKTHQSEIQKTNRKQRAVTSEILKRHFTFTFFIKNVPLFDSLYKFICTGLFILVIFIIMYIAFKHFFYNFGTILSIWRLCAGAPFSKHQNYKKGMTFLLK